MNIMNELTSDNLDHLFSNNDDELDNEVIDEYNSLDNNFIIDNPDKFNYDLIDHDISNFKKELYDFIVSYDNNICKVLSNENLANYINKQIDILNTLT